MEYRIPFNKPFIVGKELYYISQAVSFGNLSGDGHYTRCCSELLEERFGIGRVLMTPSCTSALELATSLLGLETGDEVILPSFTIISCALAVIPAGATPVLVDSDPTTWTMDTGQLAARITGRTRAIMPVHIYGHPVDMDPVMELAERHGLAVVEDAAEAHGAEYLSGRRDGEGSWRRCAGFGRTSSFSFYANKILTTGEGGMRLEERAVGKGR